MFSTQLKPSPNTDPLNDEMPTALSLIYVRNYYTKIFTTQISLEIQKTQFEY